MMRIGLILCFAGLPLIQGQTAPEKKKVVEKGYHYAHPKNTGPTPESAKETNSEKESKRQKRSELDGVTPPTHTPDVKLDTKPTP